MNVSVKALIYTSRVDGKLYKVSAITTDPLKRSQVSNETGIAQGFCGTINEVDLSNFDNSVYFYQLAGQNGCGGSDNARFVR